MRRRNQAPSDGEAPAFGPEVDHGRSPGLRWREAPAQNGELVRSILEAANDGRRIRGPDVVARLQVRSGRGPLHRDARLTERREVLGVGDGVAEVVAHGSTI